MKRYVLKQRIHDVYSGAVGEDWDDNDGYYADAEDLSKILPALQKILDPDNKKQYAFRPDALYNFKDVESATEFLWIVFFKYAEEE